MSDLIQIQTVWQLDGIPESIWEKISYEKRQAKLPSMQRVY